MDKFGSVLGQISSVYTNVSNIVITGDIKVMARLHLFSFRSLDLT